VRRARRAGFDRTTRGAPSCFGADSALRAELCAPGIAERQKFIHNAQPADEALKLTRD
jgi:hypothetical protein